MCCATTARTDKNTPTLWPQLKTSPLYCSRYLSVASFCACSSSDSSNTNDSDDGYPLTEADTVTSPEVANLHNPLPSIPTPQHLSGNFGELRNNHFHSGLDFKTNGRTGYRVAAADSGFVSRIVVSPWGFGRAVYVEHPRTGAHHRLRPSGIILPDIDKKCAMSSTAGNSSAST